MLAFPPHSGGHVADLKDRDKQLSKRAAIDRLIRSVPPGKTRDILIRQRDRIPIADPGADEPGITPPRPRPGEPDRPSIDPRYWPEPSPVDHPEWEHDPPRLSPCVTLSSRANNSLAAGENRWWQNWGKTKSFIAERTFFPTNVYELARAVTIAEDDNRPVRAVGGGWSFSDLPLPGEVTPERPFALGVEALAELVPLTETFPSDPFDPVIASVEQPPRGGPPDAPGSLEMFNTGMNGIDRRWRYLGGGAWRVEEAAKHDLMAQRSWHGIYDVLSIDDFTDAEYVDFAFDHGFRPVPLSGDDGPGTLAMAVTRTGGFATGFFYNGNGMWTLGPLGPRPRQMPLKDLPLRNVHPRPSTPAQAMALLRTPQPVYLINTQSMASSLQQNLSNLLSEEALQRTRSTLLSRAETHYFHVEAGITMEALTKLLEHQSPRLAVEGLGGNPGATLAGALATGTHGGEHNRPLLSDRVKAVHLVGPGGLQWWMEGEDSIADPDKLLEAYPCLARERIICGDTRVGGLSAQEWLDAVVVNLGCMGVVYSMVLEVEPLFGIHEAVVETTWSSLLSRASLRGAPITPSVLRGSLSDADRRALGAELVRLLEDGERNGTGIRREDNRYIDLAIDPNPFPALGDLDGLGDLFRPGVEDNWSCWVLNREVTQWVPFDPKPMPTDPMGRVAAKLGEGMSREPIAHRLQEIFDVDFIRRLQDQDVPVDAIYRAANQIPKVMEKLERWLSSTDKVDTALDVLTAPIDAADDSMVTRTIVSAVLSGLLGIEGERADATLSASKMGAVGFPTSGIMGTAIEIALSAEDAWPFLQTEILDRVTRPFFGYVSVRICPAARAHLGMQQFAPSVMLEVVAFGTSYARRFIADLEQRTVARIKGGLNAMLHWGLENEQLDAEALRSIPALNDGRLPKLAKFLMARLHLKEAAPTAPSVFDNAATRRLGL